MARRSPESQPPQFLQHLRPGPGHPLVCDHLGKGEARSFFWSPWSAHVLGCCPVPITKCCGGKGASVCDFLFQVQELRGGESQMTGLRVVGGREKMRTPVLHLSLTHSGTHRACRCAHLETPCVQVCPNGRRLGLGVFASESKSAPLNSSQGLNT